MKKNPLTQILVGIGSFLAAIVGRVSWSSPPWAAALCHKSKSRPGQFWGSVLGGLVVIALLGYGYVW